METPVPNMLKTLFLGCVLLILSSVTVFAQQMITFKSGLQFRITVLEKTADTVCFYSEYEPTRIQCVPMFLVSSIRDADNLIDGKNISYWEKKVKKYTTMTAIGAVFLTGGAILGGVGLNMVNQSATGSSGEINGALLFMGSMIYVAAGTAFTLIGAINLAKANHKLKKFKLEMSANPSISGLTVRLKF